LILYMGSSIMIGSFVGGFGSSVLNDLTINVTYAILATLAAIMKFIPNKEINDFPLENVTFNKFIATTIAFLVGIAAGIVGAAGAFILVPIMLVVLKIPIRMTIASSLAITFLSSIGSVIGKISTNQVLLYPAIILIISSLLGGPIGANISKKINTKYLKLILSILILMTAIKLWYDMFA